MTTCNNRAENLGAGWNINLYKDVGGTWQLEQSVTTDSNGNFSFPTIQTAGSYYACEVVPAGWTQQVQNWSGTPYHIATANLSGNASEGPYCRAIDYPDTADRSNVFYFGNVDTAAPQGNADYHGGQESGGIIYLRAIDDLSFTETIDDNYGAVRATYLVQKLSTTTNQYVGFCGNWNSSSSGSHPLGGTTHEVYTVGSVKNCVADVSLWTDGTYKIFHAAYDVTGNEGKYNQNRQVFVIDSLPPTAPTITKPTPRQWFKTTPIRGEWTPATDDGGVATYQVAYGYDDGHTFGGSTCPSVTDINGTPVSGCRDATNTYRNHSPSSSEQGGVTIWVRAIDNAGNEGPWSAPVHYFYDGDNPDTTLVVPTSTVSTNFSVSGVATDNLALNRAYVQLVNRQNSQRYGGTTIYLSGTSTPWSHLFDITALGLPDGDYAAHVSVVDNAGNTAAVGWSNDFTLSRVSTSTPGGGGSSTVTPTTIVVDDNNLHDWSSAVDAMGITDLVAATGSPLGIGALKLVTAASNPSRAKFTHSFAIPLNKLTSLSYRTNQLAAADTTNGNVTLRIGINLTGTGTSTDDELMYEPYYNGFNGTTMPGWNQWNISSTTGKFWSNFTSSYNGLGGVSAGDYASNFTLNDVLHDHPNAKIVSLTISMGTWNPAQTVLVDELHIATDTEDTTYDFEPVITAPVSPTYTYATTTVMSADLDTETNRALAATNNSGKWFFYNDENDTIDNTLGSFVTGPSTPLLGLGSAEMSVTGTQRRNLATYKFKDIKLADIATLKFSTYSQSQGNGSPSAERAPYLNFNVDFNNSDSWQKRLVYVPGVNGTVTNDTWQTWDAVNGGNAMWRYSGSMWPAGMNSTGNIPGTTARSWNDILADYPNAETLSTDSWFGFRVGEPYADGFTGNVDNFVIGIRQGANTNTETYDFEPTAVAPTTPNNSQQTFTSGSTVGGSVGFLAAPSGLQRVLGASTTADGTSDYCADPYLLAPLGFGWDNSAAEVSKLQNFLNRFLSANLPITGFFGTLTRQAVMDFQLKYASDILAPWGITNPTGMVYHTTKKKINELVCTGQTYPLTAAQLEDIRDVRTGVTQVTISDSPEGEVAGASTTATSSTSSRAIPSWGDQGEDQTDMNADSTSESKPGFFKSLWNSIFGN